MELFDQNGCLTEEGLHAVIGGQLDELGRLEAAEHLSYCDECMDHGAGTAGQARAGRRTHPHPAGTAGQAGAG